MQHTTRASEAPCRHCRRPLLYAWDEGLLVKADAAALDEPVADALRDAGRRVYARTGGGFLVYEPAERRGALRLVTSRHAEHVCRREPAARPVKIEKLELFDLALVRPPAHMREGAR